MDAGARPAGAVKADLRRAYDRDAVRRDGLDLGWRRDVLDDWLDTLGPEPAVVELGAGTGQAAAYVARRTRRTIAVDLSLENAARCRHRGLAAVVADFFSLPFASGSFDAAFALNALLHVPKAALDDVAGEIARVLTAGGRLLVVNWGGRDHEGIVEGDPCDPPRFYSFFSDDDFGTLTLRGFDVVERRLVHVAKNDLHLQALWALRHD